VFTPLCQVWIPELVFSNSVGDVQIVNDDFAYLMVRREQVEPAVLTSEALNEDQFFSGSQNPFVLTRYLLQTFPKKNILFQFTYFLWRGIEESRTQMDYS
jgi:hypothetical protein